MKRGLQLPIKVKPSAMARTVRERAIKKQWAYGHVEDGNYKFPYPSFSLVNKLPDTDTDFTPEGYAIKTGRLFKRISLCLCSSNDYEAICQTGKTKFKFLGKTDMI